MLIARRLLFALAAIFVASALIFAATDALPGDYATATLGHYATAHRLAVLRQQLGLERPMPVRYASWLSDVAHGNLGKSYTGVTAWSLIRPRLINSLALALAAILFTVPIAVALGVVTGLRAGGALDNASSLITIVAVSLPEFVIGLLFAALFGILLSVLPATSILPPDSSGFSHPRQLLLPAAAAASVTIGYIARMTRAATIDVIDSDYIRAARLRGITGNALIRNHILRNALIPAITVVGNNVAWMLTGLVAVELVFAYPGLGSLLVNGITTRDAPLISGICLLITIAFISVNFITETIAILLNPRAAAQH
jgi:peptide/nickel transport system permease protein